MSLKDNLRAVMDARKENPNSLSVRSHVPQPTIHRILTGESADPRRATIDKLARALGVTLDDLYLRGGELRADHNTEPGPDLRGHVPLISWVQAGTWCESEDTLHPGEGELIATTYQTRPHTYALRVVGDSMEPKFPDGAILIVEPEESPRNGAYVIVTRNGGEATFKQYVSDGSRAFLKPLNPRYPIMEMDADARFCGVVKRMEMDV